MMTKQPICILGIETSCDETALAIYDSERGLLAHRLHSQIKLHAQYGGVVPELASRDHIRKILPLLEDVLHAAAVQPEELSAIAYTSGPGLIGALLVGAAFAHSLALVWNIPTIPVHHMEAHLLAPFLEPHAPNFPFVALLVSGGHTQLVAVKAFGDYKILGMSLDDAAGEAFDKVAKILGLGYPGGPALAALAAHGDTKRFRFPRPMLKNKELNFSFSGLKTFALNCFANHKNENNICADIAAAFQDAVIDVLLIKAKRALEVTGFNNLVVAGGVSANLILRQKLNELSANNNFNVFYPRLEFCTDNGAMVAYAGYRNYAKRSDSLKISVVPRIGL